MGAFGGFTLTNKGRNLQAKAQAGAVLNYTRAAIGDGTLTGQSIVALTALISAKKTLPITKLRMIPPDRAAVGTIISNQSITTGFYFREIGIFAQDPDEGEVLYAYANSGANAEYLPPAGGPDVIEKSIDMLVVVGRASQVTATIDSSLVFATLVDVEEALDDAKAYTDESIGKTSLFGTTTMPSANAYAVTIADGPPAPQKFMRITVEINANSTAAATLSYNGSAAIPIRKMTGAGAAAVTNLKANGIYTLVYSGSAFILQGEGGEYGTAGAGDVRAGKSIGTDAGLITGTLPTRSTTSVTSNGQLASGIYDNPVTISVPDPSIGSTAVEADVLAGRTFRSNGTARTGTMPNLTGVRTAQGVGKWGDGGLAVYPERGYQKGGAGDGEIKVSVAQLQAADPDLAAANIRAGVEVYGVVGTLQPQPGLASGATILDLFETTASGTMVNSGSPDIPYTAYRLLSPVSGVLRVVFSLYMSQPYNTNQARAQIYKNGQAFGTKRSISSFTPVQYTEDLAFNAGDEITLRFGGVVDFGGGSTFVAGMKIIKP